MSISALSRRITDFGYTLLENELALDVNYHIVSEISRTRRTIRWQRDDPNASLIIDNPAKINDYIALLDRREFSFLLVDGSIIQIAYTFNRDEIDGHRLLYYPCPVFFKPDSLADSGLAFVDVVRDSFSATPEKDIMLRSPIRFDFAPNDAGALHPASHVTINEACCRIPVKAPMRFDCFIRFIFENFFPNALEIEGVSNLLLGGTDTSCLSAHDTARAHLFWA